MDIIENLDRIFSYIFVGINALPILCTAIFIIAMIVRFIIDDVRNTEDSSKGVVVTKWITITLLVVLVVCLIGRNGENSEKNYKTANSDNATQSSETSRNNQETNTQKSYQLPYSQRPYYSSNPLVPSGRNVESELRFIDTEKVENSFISGLGYDVLAEELYVWIKDDNDSSEKLYIYFGVPENIWLEFEFSDPIGDYHNQFIRGWYECERIY